MTDVVASSLWLELREVVESSLWLDFLYAAAPRQVEPQAQRYNLIPAEPASPLRHVMAVRKDRSAKFLLNPVAVDVSPLKLTLYS